MKKFFLSFLVVVTLLGAPFSSAAVTAQEMTPPPEVRDITTTEIKGEVVRREGETVVIQTSEGTKEITVPQTVTVKRNTVESNISEVNPGDDVTITQTSEGQVLSMDAVSGEVADYSRWLIPLLIAALIIGFLIWTLLKKQNQSHIKTTVS